MNAAIISRHSRLLISLESFIIIIRMISRPHIDDVSGSILRFGPSMIVLRHVIKLISPPINVSIRRFNRALARTSCLYHFKFAHVALFTALMTNDADNASYLAISSLYQFHRFHHSMPLILQFATHTFRNGFGTICFDHIWLFYFIFSTNFPTG
jgi:hypothetical protein